MSYGACGIDGFRIGLVANIKQTYLEVFSPAKIGSSCRFVIQHEPVRADDVWILQCCFHEVRISICALVLIKYIAQAGMGKPAVQCAKVDLANDDGHISISLGSLKSSNVNLY